MNNLQRLTFAALATAASLVIVVTGNGAPPAVLEAPSTELPTANEARARAQLLHETLHATLQVVHHEYYREDEALAIPAATLKKVFHELATRQKVELRWLAVNAQPMNADHIARDPFEKLAVAALADGKEAYEQAEDGVYRHAAAITLTSDCLGCHAPTRTSNKDRTAGLVITMPIQKQ